MGNKRNYREILFKEEDPNEGLMIEVSPSHEPGLVKLNRDPIAFLDNNGALGFTKGWAHKETNTLGGNSEVIKNINRITIFNQNKHIVQNWLFIEVDMDATHLEVVGQTYEILKHLEKFE